MQRLLPSKAHPQGCKQVYETDSLEPVNSINDTYWTIRAEAVPEDELAIPEGDRILFLCHVSVNEGKHVSPKIGSKQIMLLS